MKKVIRLNEAELVDIVKKVISERTALGQKGFQQGKQIQKAVVKTVQQVIQIGKTTVKTVVVGTIMVFIIAGKTFQLALNLGKAVVSFLGSLAKQVGGIVVKGATQVAQDTTNLVKTASKNVAEFFNTLFGAIKSLGAKAWAAALSLASKIGAIWNYIKSWATNALKNAWASAKKTVGKVVQGAKNIGSKIAQGAKGAYDYASGLVSGIFGEGVLEMMLEDFHYYKSLPTKKMLHEIYLDTRSVL